MAFGRESRYFVGLYKDVRRGEKGEVTGYLHIYIFTRYTLGGFRAKE